jgi:hypothetical protein
MVFFVAFVVEVCENIGPAQRRLRQRIGVASFTLAALIAALLLYLDATRGWRLLALPPIWIGTLSLIEAKTRTCVMLAARGLRNLDAGNEAVTDGGLRDALNARARQVHLRAAVLALALAGALLAYPGGP